MDDLRHRLTQLDDKVTLFELDAGFMGALSSMASAGPAIRDQFLDTVALLVLKPEALMARRGAHALRALYRHGFAVAAIEPFVFTPHLAGAFWRYSWNCATPARLALVRELNGLAPAIALWLAAEAEGGTAVPASVRLSRLKGAAYPEGRDPDSVRQAVGARNPVLSFVHVSDEPADVVRETALILETRNLADFVQKVIAAQPLTLTAAIGAIEAVERTTLCFAFDVAPEEQIPLQPFLNAAPIAVLFDRLDRTDPQAVPELVSRLSAVTPADLPGLLPTIDGDTYARWRERAIATSLPRDI